MTDICICDKHKGILKSMSEDDLKEKISEIRGWTREYGELMDLLGEANKREIEFMATLNKTRVTNMQVIYYLYEELESRQKINEASCL